MITEEMPKKQQKGGKLLGQGVYGCAFDPPLLCKKSLIKNGHRVGKILPTDDAKYEMSISNILKEVQDADKYFVIVEDMCDIKPKSEQTDPDLKNCLPIKGESFSQLKQIIMPFGGKPLYNIPRRASNIDYFKLGQHLLEAGTLLLTKKIVHGDLHTMNVLLDSTDRGRIIDFGLAWSPSNLTLASVRFLDRQFNPAISQEPPEVSAWNGLLDGLTLNQTLARIQDQKSGIQLCAKVYNQPIQHLMNYLRRFVDNSWSFQQNNRYAFYKLYWSKIDAWALGSMLLALFIEMSMDTDFEKQPGFMKQMQTVLKTCKGLMMMDAGLRWDCAEALEVWAPDSPILQRTDVQEWLKQQSIARNQMEKIVLDF